MVDRARADLDRERDGSLLRELVAVQPEREAGRGASFEVAPGLLEVECSAFEEDVGRLGDPGRLGQDFGQREVEVCLRVLELGRHCMGAEPGRDAAGSGDRP